MLAPDFHSFVRVGKSIAVLFEEASLFVNADRAASN